MGLHGGIIFTNVCFKLWPLRLQILNGHFADEGKSCIATVKGLPPRSPAWTAPQGKANVSKPLPGHLKAVFGVELVWKHLCEVVKKWEILCIKVVHAFFLVVKHGKWSLIAPFDKLFHVGVQA